MKIIHTADLHLGQIIYQHYDRSDEHGHFFHQLTHWCKEEKPDALIMSGDVFDIQQPSATVKKVFTDYFVELHRDCPEMRIVITAGNHDSASRLQADQAVWEMAGTTLVGIPPMANCLEKEEGWQDEFIVRLESGYIIALPYMSGEREEIIQSILNRVEGQNTKGLPVVLMAHQAITGLDIAGHDFNIGTLRTIGMDKMGKGFDYLALGHIHKPQTLDHQDDAMKEEVCYPAPVGRYSGSALHVSCDEAYPHSVSLVEIDRHGGNVHIHQLRIDEWRHFYVLPGDGSSYKEYTEALTDLDDFIQNKERGYIRFRFDYNSDVPPNFGQMVYEKMSVYNDEWRYNPKIEWTGDVPVAKKEKVVFEVQDLTQMTDPMIFIEKTIDRYPGWTLEELSEAFAEINDYIDNSDTAPAMAEAGDEEEKATTKKTTKRKNKKA